MNTGKIILASSAFIVTLGSSLAFKVTYKFNVHKYHVQIRNANGQPSKCLACVTKWFLANGVVTTKCKTEGGGFAKGDGPGHYIFYTFIKAGSVKTCTHAVSKCTLIQ